ncbi:MAG: DEAD/DEAH box helicase [Candidatus Gottesmanbacteria bacterium]|nr:DEAD/DEAH box helicase [Candidatus Gottesmanbacteria bacterium]
MRFDRPHFQRRGFSGGNRSRPIKTVPKAALMASIAQSKIASQREPVVSNEPIITHVFADFALDRQLQENIRAKSYVTPTPIQDQVIPAILAGRDVIGTAKTGTGKTAAFLIPLIQKVTLDRAQRVLVVAPTRELAYQIHKELRDFARGLSIRSALLIGGTGEWRQKEDLYRDPHFVIATPGRLKDFIETRAIRLSGFRNVVLDEADRMVDIGFINDIKYFISLIPKERQSLFFSATISGGAGEILTDFVRNPVKVSVNTQDSKATIMQDVIPVPGNTTKLAMLHEMLKKKEFDKVLVFGRTKHGVQRLSDELEKRGVRAGAIHGNKRQNQRQYVLNQFARSEIQILLATDVASRGLDIPNVSHVINWDLPETMDDYTHRIGRTGRANKQGIALTFID